MGILSNLKSVYKQKSFRSVAIYTFTNFFGKSASFLLLFVFTNPLYITPSENGLLSLFSNSMLLLMPFLSMGIIHSTSAEYFKLNKKEFKDLFTTGFVMPFIIMIISCVILFLFRQELYDNYGFPEMFVWLIPLITFLVFFNEQLLGIARNTEQPGIFLKANISKISLELIISFVLVVFLAWRWEGRVAGILISYVIVAIYGFHFFFKNDFLFGTVRKKYILSELIYAVPVIAMQTSIFCMSASDRFFLSHFIDDNNETVGIYNVVVTFGSVMIILSTALLQYIFPKIYTELSKDNINYGSIRNSFKMYTMVMLAGFILIVLLTPVAYHFFINDRYHSALRFVIFTTGGYFLWTIAYFFYSFLLFFKEKRKILALSICCIIVSLSFNYFFIGKWGMWGAAISHLAAYGIVLILTLAFTRSYWKRIFILKP